MRPSPRGRVAPTLHRREYGQPSAGDSRAPARQDDIDVLTEPQLAEEAAATYPRGTDLLHQTAEMSRARSGETILIVEDDDGVRNDTAVNLSELGYRVLEAVDARSALGIIERETRLRLLFTDLGPPGGINGLMLAERALKLRPALKVLLAAADAESALVDEGRLDQHPDWLTKPFTFAALVVKVQELLGSGATQPRILVVEDELLVRMMVADTLTEAGCHVEEAVSATEGLAKFRAAWERLDAAVIDVGLPDGRGDELVAQIRAKRRELPIILATGYTGSRLPEQFAHDERLRILIKPFAPADLRGVLRNLGIQAREPESSDG
jgi:CheY-like chemotaxis protein